MSAFSAVQVAKSFRKGNKQVLQSVDFSANSGECIGIIGANGSGKTTLLSILAGIMKPDGGSVSYDDVTVSGNGFRRIVSYVPQENPLIDELSARDNLRLWYGDRMKNIEQEQAGLIGILGISEFIDERVRNLSGGMKKRLSICCAVAGDQPVLLMDEPGASLDLPCKERIGVYVNYRKQNGAIVIMATHEEQEIRMCDRIFLLKDGRLEAVDFDGDIHTLVGLI